MLELYHFYGATCGLKARLAVHEKQVVLMDRAVERSYLKTPDYLALNPNGVVPTLVHDSVVLTESTVIINYIDDAFAGPLLKPPSPTGRAHALWWMKRADDCLASIGILTYTVSMRPKLRELGPAELEAYLQAIPSLAVRARRSGIIRMGFENPDFQLAIAILRSMLEDMEEALANCDWLAGESYTLADMAMTPLIERLAELGFTGIWYPRSVNMARWWDGVRARASYAACVVGKPNPEALQHTRYGREAWPHIMPLFASS